MDMRTQYFIEMATIACILCSGSSAQSLWGRKAVFTPPHCSAGYWRLAEVHTVPPQDELSVCVALSQKILSPKWTAFTYKQLGGTQVELGVTGQARQLQVWLFGNSWEAPVDLPRHFWHTVCLTWSAQSRNLRLYVNDSSILEVRVNETEPGQPCCLPGGGSLTLGASHGYIGGKFQVEMGSNFMGEISLFRMWRREREAHHLANFSCIEGDVARWDTRNWETQGCSPQPATNLQCVWSLYDIQMRICISPWHGHRQHHANSVEKIVDHWLTTTFPSNITVHRIIVTPSARKLHLWDHHLPKKNMGDKGRGIPWMAPRREPWFECQVFVSVTPRTDVREAQTYISGLLSVTYGNSNLTLHRETNSTWVNPVDAMPMATLLPPDSTEGTTDSISSTPTAKPIISMMTVSPSVTMPASVASSYSQAMTSSDQGQTWTDNGQARPDVFYMVRLNVTVSNSSKDPAETIQTWLQNTLEVEGMLVLNFALHAEDLTLMPPTMEDTLPGMDTTSLQQQKSYGCSFQVHVRRPLYDITKTKELISELLIRPYSNGSLSVQAHPGEISIRHIDPGWCPEQVELTEWGLYSWPQTKPQRLIRQPCKGDPSEEASRLCKLNGVSGKVNWTSTYLLLCPPVATTISDLREINITANNSADMVNIIGELVGNSTDLSLSQIETALDKLEEVVHISQLTASLATDIVNIIDGIIEHGTDLLPVTNQILNITDSMGDKILFSGSTHNITTPSLALSLVNVNLSQFDGLTFGVSSFSDGLDPKIFINEKLPNDTVAFVALPREVEMFFPQGEKTQPRVQFHFYGTPDLFQGPENQINLYTHVVSASITNTTRDVKDLKRSVTVTLRHHTPNMHNEKVVCVYWNFHSNGNRGGWDTAGCERGSTTVNHTTCLCDHLTHFAVLLDISRSELSETDKRILHVISHLGCGISSVFLVIILLTYTIFEKLRKDYPSKILINLSLALLGLNLTFVLNSWLSSHGEVLCIAVAATLHYFTLASFTWMGLEAVNMYLALVKVFNVYVSSYMVKFCILGWGVPLVMVSTVLAVEQDAYGSRIYEDAAGPPGSTEHFCWVQHDVVFYVSVVTYILLILICNISVFGLVMVQIQKMRANKPAGIQNDLMQDLRSAASLTFLLGLTWILAFFSWGPFKVPLSYLFSILNSLQGFFLFLFYCLMKENVRKLWKVHLCCGHFVPYSEHSEWSRSVAAGRRFKPNQLSRTPSAKSDDSNETRRTSSSSDPSQQQSSSFRSSLDLVYEDGIGLPNPYPDSSPPRIEEASLSSTLRFRH